MQTCSASKRLDTGALKPENDWPGIFIRGDEAIGLAQQLRYWANLKDIPSLRRLSELLDSCAVKSHEPATQVQDYPQA